MAAELSPRFKRYIDDASGRAYIHDAETGEVRWELPDEEWIKLTDKATGRTFWYNQKTKRSQWENPAFRVIDEMNESDAEMDAADVEKWKCYEDSKTGRLYWHNSETGESSWSKPAKLRKKKQDAVSLGVHPQSQWEKFWDPNTRRVFFFHRQLGLTQWERPIELGTWSPGTKEAASTSNQKEKAGNDTQAPVVARKLFQENTTEDDLLRNSLSKEETVTSPPEQSAVEAKVEDKNDLRDTRIGINESRSANEAVEKGGKKLDKSSISPSNEESPRSTIASSSSLDDAFHVSSGTDNGRPIMDKEDIIICGHLYEAIELPRIAKREWRIRFFWLTSDGLLHCGASPKQRDVACIDVKELASVQEEDSARMEFALLGSLGKSLAVLRARSPEEYRLWLEKLSNVILETTTELDEDDASRKTSGINLEQPSTGNRKEERNHVSPFREGAPQHPVEVVQAPISAVASEKPVENPAPESNLPKIEEIQQSADQYSTEVDIVEDIDIEVFTVSISSPESRESSPKRDRGNLSPIQFHSSRAGVQAMRNAAKQNIDDSPREATLLQRIFSRNEPVLLAYVEKQSEFRAANRRVHEEKLDAAVALFNGGSSDGNCEVPQQTAPRNEDSKSMIEYGALWHALRKHPEVLASIGACQRTNEARKLFAATLATAFLDLCSVPESLCLQQVMAHCQGTAFERPLCDAVAGYRGYREYGRTLVGILFHDHEVPGGLTVDDVLDFSVDALRTSCPSVIRSFGRGFLTSLIVSTIQLSFDQIAVPDIAWQVIAVIEARSSQGFESTVRGLLHNAADELAMAADDDGSPIVGIEEWDILVCSRFELSTLHMAVSKFPFSLPDDVQQCVNDLGVPLPCNGPWISRPFVLLEHGPRFAGPGSAEPERDFLRHVREHISRQTISAEDEDDGTEDKVLIREILALAEKARLEMHLLENSIRRVAKFAEEFAPSNTSLPQRRFMYEAKPARAADLTRRDEPLKEPPPSPQRQTSPFRAVSTSQKSPVFGPISVDWETSSSGSERRIRSEEVRRRRHMTTSPQSAASVEYASRTRSQTSRPLSAGTSAPQYKPWVCPSNTRSFHV